MKSRKEQTVCPQRSCATRGELADLRSRHGAQVGRSLPSSCKGRRRIGRSARWTKAPPTLRFFCARIAAGGSHPERRAAADPQTARDFCEREIAPAAAWDREEAIDPRSSASWRSSASSPRRSPTSTAASGSIWSRTRWSSRSSAAPTRTCAASSRSRTASTASRSRAGARPSRQARLPPAARRRDGAGCYALTEPGAGSDPGGLETRAERDGDDWVLSGQKIFITLGSWAARARVFARTGEPGPRGITCFVVPTDAPGFEARPIKGKLGLRAQDTAELFLDGVRVSDDDRLGDLGAGFKVAMSALDHGRVSLGAGCVGIAQGCLDASIAYTTAREQFGRPSPASSSSRSCSPTSRSRRRPHASSSGVPRRPPTAASATPSRRHSRSTSRARRPCAPRTPRCRRTAATATSTSTRSASTCATLG